MAKRAMVLLLALSGIAASVEAGTFFGALSNFDAVNDTGSPCNGFEIELDDVRSSDVTYTFDYQRYGVPKISEDTFVSNGVTHPRTFVRWMSAYDQASHAFVDTTPTAAPGFANTGGHLCYKSMVVGGQPYETSGCEHFGVGTLTNPSASVYRWMKEDPNSPGSLIAQGNPVSIPAPVWTVNPMAGAPPVVVAVIPVPPPPAVVPVPYLPEAEFGVAVWAKVFETESDEHADLEHLVSDDEHVPGNLGPVPNPDAVTEIEWQILQTDSMNPTANELASEKQLGNGKESVTRRYEFYQYLGPYEVHTGDGPNTGTNEALCAEVGEDGKHGRADTVTIFDAAGNSSEVDCASLIVVGDYIGAQNAAANVATPLSANGANLVKGEVGARYPDRPLIFGGSGGPYSITFTSGTLPASDAGNEFALDPLTGILRGGIANGAGTSTFTVHATDLAEPSQAPVDATFHLSIVDAVRIDDIAIAAGNANATTSVDLTASGGESPFVWSAVAASAGLQVSVFGNALSLLADQAGDFDVQVSVADSLGGMDTRTLTYVVDGGGPSTPTPTEVAPTVTPTQSMATPSATVTTALSPTPTATTALNPTPTATTALNPTPTATAALNPTPTATTALNPTPTATATSAMSATATIAVSTATITPVPPTPTPTPSLTARPRTTPTIPQHSGCQSSPQPGSATALLLSALALVARPRRDRRRSPMR